VEVIQPGLSSVVTWEPSASLSVPLTQPRWLGALGHVTQLTYSYVLPGGPDQMSCLLQVEPTFRTDAMNPGRIVQVMRGGSVVWEGILQEPVPSPSGWQITAVGAGNYGTNFCAVYATWNDQNDAVNQAIARGLRWVNPGIPSGVWLGQQVDSGAQQITDLLNLFCTLGGYVWYVGRGNVLSVYPIPAAESPSDATRALTCISPVPRTLGGDVDRIFFQFQTSRDNATAATYGLATVTDAPSLAKYGALEVYEDLSSAGLVTLGTVDALGANVFQRYQRASFSGPFTVRQGELLMPGGGACDLGQEQAGMVCTLLCTNFGYGGEVSADPVTFLVGAYEYNDQAQTAQVTPFQALDMSIANMLTAAGTHLGGGSGKAGSYGGTAGEERRHHRKAAAARKKRRAEAAKHRHINPGGPMKR
jgi:hypothetical protein